MTRPRKILVVDDEPDLEHLLQRRMSRDLRDGRYEFCFSRNGSEALDRLQIDRSIELVLADINMPGMTGLTLLEQIPEVAPNIRAVIVSAYDDMANIRTAMNRGAYDFVTKPINFNDLRTTIDKTLNHVELLRSSLEARDQLVALHHELDIARDMQQSILPRNFPETPGYQFFGHMEPARQVGGDFFDVVNIRDGNIGLTVADVSGKGVPAAMFMMSSHTFMKSSVIRGSGPAEVLGAVNALLAEGNESVMFVTLFHAVLDPDSGKLQYANGGHNPPIIVRPDGSCTVLPTTGGMALGVVPGLSYRQESATLEPGDIAILYSDGVTEATNAENEEFGMNRLQAAIAHRQPRSAREVTQTIFEAVHAFAGNTPQFDDITCLVVVREFQAR